MKTGITPAMLRAEAVGLGMAAGTPGAIEASEAAGQAELVNSEALPADMWPSQEEIAKETGIVFGDMIDDIFISATLPKGWKKQATDHSMHSDLIDDRGRVRASIFYKAAFYDRRASTHFKRFYSVGGDWEKHEVKVLNADGDTVKDFRSVDVPADFNDPKWRERNDEYEELRKEAEAWLDENYPDHANPFAYWR